MWSVLGMGAFVVAANIPLEFWQKMVKPMYVATIVALILVLIFAPHIAGARRWLRIGGFSLQPSEIAKLTVVMVTADYLDRRQSRLRDFKRGILPLLILAGFPILLVAAEKDFGTPFLITVVFFCLLMLGHVPWRHLILMGISVIPVLVLAILKVRYRLNRLLTYLNPWADAHGKGYQLVQSLLAMGGGGYVGRGLGQSIIKINNLPEAHTDFIFSVLGEELGLMGTLTCAVLFLYLCQRGLRIAKNANSFFSRLVAAGISLTIGFQALINMGVACGLFPTKGMPLPFISFGGSSLFITLFSVGILASISRQMPRAIKI
jgi:cell division protein FtsW